MRPPAEPPPTGLDEVEDASSSTSGIEIASVNITATGVAQLWPKDDDEDADQEPTLDDGGDYDSDEESGAEERPRFSAYLGKQIPLCHSSLDEDLVLVQLHEALTAAPAAAPSSTRAGDKGARGGGDMRAHGSGDMSAAVSAPTAAAFPSVRVCDMRAHGSSGSSAALSTPVAAALSSTCAGDGGAQDSTSTAAALSAPAAAAVSAVRVRDGGAHDSRRTSAVRTTRACRKDAHGNGGMSAAALSAAEAAAPSSAPAAAALSSTCAGDGGAQDSTSTAAALSAPAAAAVSAVRVRDGGAHDSRRTSAVRTTRACRKDAHGNGGIFGRPLSRRQQKRREYWAAHTPEEQQRLRDWQARHKALHRRRSSKERRGDGAQPPDAAEMRGAQLE
ncbi:hypothetical protein JKP88DRAFT_335555 [Tribonema minus]|uniref:Uncharacterized protein n=1 Tax=Tribonema minus TaxID=303371 RepID=A0A835YJM4_9STRA|nr:hypothetical protein JKP88DRAFT_335555 [Tribonema minus]